MKFPGMSEISEAAQNAGRHALGRIEPARVVVFDYREAAARKTLSPGDVAKVMNGGIPAFGGGGASQKILNVQYNPSELQVYAASEPMVKKDTRAAEDGAQETVDVTVGVAKAELSVNLCFDKTRAEGLVQQVKAGADSVQKEVEGFLAALQNPYTRVVGFFWSGFSFIGQLINVSAEYTMFSGAGRPVRAKVSLRLRNMGDEELFSQWEGDFGKAFGGKTANLVKPEQDIIRIPI